MPKKFINCNVCGYEFEPLMINHYITRDDGKIGFAALSASKEPIIWDTFDCPKCGCQVRVQERKRIDIHNIDKTVPPAEE